MKAKGLFVVDYMKLDVREYEVPEMKANQVLIKTMATGLCCWDSWLYRGVNAPGPYPYIIGHEGAGIVEAVGSEVTNFKPGDKVSSISGGVMGEYDVLDASALVKLPDDVEDWEKVVYEPTACVTNLLAKSHIEMGDHVVLVGAGYMGTLCLQGLCRASQAGRITVFELREDRRKMAMEYPGVDEVLDPESEEGKKFIKDLQDKGGADVVIDFGASLSGFALADSMTKQGGKLIIGTFHRTDVTFNGTKWHLGGLQVYNLPPQSNPKHFKEWSPAVGALIKRGVFEPGKLMTHTAYFEDLDAVTDMFQKSIDKTDNYMKGAILFYKK